MKVRLTLNGAPAEVDAPPLARLLDVLRGPLGLTGTKEGCGEGECGACTVLVDGEPVLSCITLAVAVDGKEITTIEGVAGADGELDPIQEEFLSENAIQCGFCTPGMILVAKDLLRRNPHPTEDEIRHHIKGNICRCTGYNGIVRAIQNAAKRLGGPEAAPATEDEAGAR